MKTTIHFVRFFLTLTILLITGVTAANAQAIQVTPNVSAGANLNVTAQTKFYSKGNSDGLKQLRSVSYNFKEEEKEQPVPEKFLEEGFDIEKMKAELKSVPKTNRYLSDRNFYGFLAQDVQKLFPDLVYADSAGMLSVDYIGIIPLLVNGLKEQQEQIDKQRLQIEELQAAVFSGAFRSDTHTEDKTDIAQVNAATAVLYQNAPNPFSERTSIRYSLPESVKTADIYIFNMQGSVVKKISAGRSGTVEIQGSDLQAGMYLYSLIADGKEVDTKRMILTR